jgi:hypothetical protein
MTLKIHPCSYDLLAKTIEQLSCSQTVTFPSNKRLVYYFLPSSFQVKKGKDHHKTKDVVISLHHFRKQHITHEQQLKRLTQRVFDFCYVQAQPRSAKYFRTMDIRYSNSGKEMEGKMW